LFLLFVPFVFLWLLLVSKKKHTVKRAVVSSVISLIILLAGVLPFTYYNYVRFHRFVLLNTNAGYVLFWANHPIHGTGFISAAEMGDTYQKLIPGELRSLDEAALDQALLREGVKFILAEPDRYLLLSLSRILPYFKFWPDKDSGMISNLARVGSFGLFLPFMIYGLLRPYFYLRGAGVNRRDYILNSPAALLYLFVIVYSLIHILTWTLVRYRLPVDAILVLFSALACAGLDQDFAHLFRQPVRFLHRRADT
jgi:branched-subunit amino acid transport protein AzlD